MELELLPTLYGELKTSFESRLFIDIELLSYIVEAVTFEAILLLAFNEPVDNIFSVLEHPAFELGTFTSLGPLITSFLVGLLKSEIPLEPST